MKKYNDDKIQWIVDQHRNTNHFYDEYLPYEFHLDMAFNFAKKYFYTQQSKSYRTFGLESDLLLFDKIKKMVYGHDLIEDTRVTYDQVRQKLGEEVAEVIYALANEKGKTRSERANDKYYEGIRNTPFATFVKLCDRLANVSYSRMTMSSMYKKYKLEHYDFIQKVVDSDDFDTYKPMIDELDDLLGLKNEIRS